MFFAYPLAFSLIALFSRISPIDASPCPSSDSSDVSSTQSFEQNNSERLFAYHGKREYLAQTLTLLSRVVYNPRVMHPTKGDEWKVGSWVEVTWDTARMPDQNNDEGKLLLGYIEDGSSSEHLDLDNPLATRINLSSGSVKIHVPEVEPREDYVVVLLGDSGNRSGKFRIMT